MQGKKQFTDQVVTHFRLSERVPPHNLYRRLDRLLDLDFLYEATQELYSHTGQPSLDPVVFFKLVLVGYLENITSDRRLLEHCALRLDILLFLGYELDEDLLWHSTLSRTRQLYPTALFEQLFDRVFCLCVAQGLVKLCVAQGLVKGDTQAVDSAPVKANASLESLCEKPAPDALPVSGMCVGQPPAAPPMPALLSTPPHQVRRVASRHARWLATPRQFIGSRHAKARLLSNKTHYSATDPEARISIKPGKARALNYLCSLAVDTAHGVISHVQADFADSRDSVHLPGLLAQMQERFRATGLYVHDVVADTGYSSGLNYALLEQQGITPWIPVFSRYKPTIDGFTYHAEADSFSCPAGKELPFKDYDTNRDGVLSKLYRASARDCRPCPRKASCIPKTQRRQIMRTAYESHYRRALSRQQSRQGQQMRQLRQSTVEPVFGSLLHHYGLRRISARGRASAHKAMLLAAVAYNLKKLLKHHPPQTLSLTMVLPKPPPPPPKPSLRPQNRHLQRTNCPHETRALQ